LPPKQKKTRFSTSTINPNNTAVAPNDLPNGERMPCGHTFHFLSLSDSKNVRTGVTPRRETKGLLRITHESCPVNKIYENLRKTDAGSPTQQKCTHLSRVKSTNHQHGPEDNDTKEFDVPDATRTTLTICCPQQE
jgi:hypothetical protein